MKDFPSPKKKVQKSPVLQFNQHGQSVGQMISRAIPTMMRHPYRAKFRDDEHNILLEVDGRKIEEVASNPTLLPGLMAEMALEMTVNNDTPWPFDGYEVLNDAKTVRHLAQIN